MDEKVLLVERQGRICTLTLNRPERRNALSPQLLLKLAETLRALDRDPETRVVVVRGAGEEAFSAGYDITKIPASIKVAPEEQPELILDRALDSIVTCRCPVIAMIYGFCMGAGFELAVTCDLRLVADSAKFAMPPAKLGTLYRLQGIQKILNLIGAANTMELFVTGRTVDATRAREMGLVNYVVPASELAQVTYNLAQEIADNAPLSVSGAKAVINRLLTYPRIDPCDQEEFTALIRRVRLSEDYQEGRRAFLEKRKPRFLGR